MSRSQTKADEEREAMDTARLNEALRKIDNTWKERVEMYNNGDLTDGKPKRGKTVTALHRVCSQGQKGYVPKDKGYVPKDKGGMFPRTKGMFPRTYTIDTI